MKPPIKKKRVRQILQSVIDQDLLLFVDLFCGGGGASTGVLRALKELGLYDLIEKGSRFIQAIAVNHDPIAIQTHTRNHPSVEHWDCDIERLDPMDALRDRLTGAIRRISILWQSSPCQDWSRAAGGPVRTPHKRATPEYLLRWVKIGQPRIILEENVWEITEKWDQWPQYLQELKDLGYRVEYRKLNAADYGTPQSRERMILIAVRQDLPIAWPKQEYSKLGKDGKPTVAGTKPWRGADTILDLDLPCPSIFTRTKWDSTNKRTRKRIPRPHSITTRRRIARHIRKQGPFWNILADAVEQFTGPVPLAHALQAVPRSQWPDWIVPCGDHVHVHEPDAFIQKHYGTGICKPVTDALDSITADGQHFSVARPFIFGAGGPTGQQTPRDADKALYTETADSRLCVGTTRFTLGQQEGAVPRPDIEPIATESTGGAIRVGEVRCVVDVGFGSDQGEWSHSKDVTEVLGSVPASNRFALAESRVILPSRGPHGDENSNPPRPTSRELPTVLAEKQTGHIVKHGVYASPGVILPHNGERKGKQPGEKGQAPRMHDPTNPMPVIPASRGFEIAFAFIFTQNGNANVRAETEPNTTITTHERHSYWTVRLADLFLDVGMRMLTILELARGQDFPDDYTFLGNGDDQRRLIGNAVPCLLAMAVTMAMLLTKGVIAPRIWDFASPEAEVAATA